MADAVPGRVGVKLCQPCLRTNAKNVADVYCKDCDEYQCKECEKMHERFPLMSKHKLVKEHLAIDVTSKYDTKGFDKCREHNILLEFFCEDENEPCCGKCAVVNHRKCRSVVEIEKIAGLKKTDFSDITRSMVQIEDRAKTIRKHLNRTKENVAWNALEINVKIQTMQDQINEMFEKLKHSVAKDIAVFQKQAFDDFDTKSSENDSCIADVKQIVAEVQAVSEQGTPVQQLIMAKHFKDQCAELQLKMDIAYSGLRDIVLKFEFEDSLKLPPENNTTPGTLTMKFVNKGPKMFTDVAGGLEKERKVKLSLLGSINLNKCRGDVEEPLYIGLDFLPDGRLVAVDNKNQKCVLLNENLDKINDFQLTFCPKAVVAVSEVEVAITSGSAKKLYFLTISKQNKFTVCRKCNLTKNYQSLCMIDGGAMLVGCYDNPQPFCVVSLSGEEREIGIQLPSKTYPHDSSGVTYIRNRNKVVFSDRFANTVYIYDMANGTRVEVKDEKLIKEPRGLAVGPADCIFVCSKNTNSIVQISHTGQILSSHVLDMKKPSSVCVSKDNLQLAVSNNAKLVMKLQLFSIEVI